MIYKLLSRNSSLKLFFNKKSLCLDFSVNILIITVMIAALISSSNIQAASASPNIINGNTPDDDANPCSEAELIDYVGKIKKDIGAKWQPVKGFEDRHVVVIFSVNQNGIIEESKVTESSGSQAVDQSALAALKLASPLTPLPKGAPPSIQIRYVFSWHVKRN